ncbi:hypothetical protein FRD01_02680 [Microvenator marinus]|jgi:hypothetical protein|uniref:Dickkopf N-terminal cysteine-rich domain-containing protein n=1 Tax=Microvenator marinus TaxID=2600177 RepID=A0A5B8XM07_9DELT|nr:hypothetical protein [Microvenator marinus]QED26181.1 hypothetical protein FRD01_02680 [Microvenator marinus]
MRYFVCIFIVLLSCSDDQVVEAPDMPADAGPDFNDMQDMLDDPDMDTDALIPCSRDTDCPRGTSCNIDVCLALRGCLFNGTPDKGCYFDHGEDFSEGYFTAPECTTSEECTDPSEPNCIAKVCSRLTPCEEDEMCPEGQQCSQRVYCR